MRRAPALVPRERAAIAPPGRRQYALSFSRDVSPDQATAALRTLTGLLPPWWRRVLFGSPRVVLEVRADRTGIAHLLDVASSNARYVTGALSAALPGLHLAELEPVAVLRVDLARELRVVGHGGLRTDATPAATAGLLAALQPLRAGESIVVQYVLSPVGSSTLARLADVLASDGQRPPPRSPEPDLGFALRVGVAAAPGRRDALLARVLGALHGAGSHDARLARRLVPSALSAVALRRRAGSRGAGSVLAVDELAAVSPLPIGGPTLPGLTLAGARPLPPVSAVPSRGIVLGDATAVSSRRPLAIAVPQLRRGLHICAPTGSGKSTVLLNLACQLMAAGQAVVLIDSKGDLAADVADHVPAERIGHALLFDPADERPLGFNLLGHATDSDLIVEHVVAGFRARYGQAGLGPRSEDILRSCLATLTRAGGMTLAEVAPLLGNAAFRQRLTATLNEPVLESFWAWFSSLSEAARAEAVAPLTNKLRGYVLSRRVRTVIAQADGLNLASVLDHRGILIVSLARGVVGEDAAALIGAAMVSRLWQAIQARAAVSPEKRPAATVICDEFQDFAALPLAFETALAQSRGYGVGWVVANQALAQLDTRLRQAVLANCRSRLVMQTTASDAAVFAREFRPLVAPDDLQALPAYHAYCAISTGGTVAPPASLRTRPAPEPTGSRAAIQQRSRALGASTDEVDQMIRQRVSAPRNQAPVGGRRRP